MNIVQLNRIVKQVANCVELVHSYSDSSPYEYWNTENVKYGSICFCIKKTRMRANITEYTALMYYGDRLLQDGSNKNEVWSNANDVLQNIIGTLNYTSDGSISVAYPYDITHFEQKFADNLAGAYAQIVITVTGIGECGNLLYGYEGSQGEIKLESIVKTITVNGEYDIVPSKEYDAISDIKVVVNVTPDPKETFARIGYNEENASKFLNQFSDDLGISATFLREWNNGLAETALWDIYKNVIQYLPAIDLKKRPTNLSTPTFREWPLLQVVPSLDFTGRTNLNNTFYNCKSLVSVGKITGTGAVTSMQNMFVGCRSLQSVDISELDTSNVTSLYRIFSSCEMLNNLDLSKWDTSNVTSLDSAFTYCYLLSNLKVSNWNTENVTNVSGTFESCSSLTSLDISGWNLSKVTNIARFLGSYSDNTYLINLKFGKNLKVSWTGYGSPYRIPNLTVESLLSIIDGLYDFTGNGETPTSSQGTCQFGTTNLNKLTDEQKAVATNKGWTLT